MGQAKSPLGSGGGRLSVVRGHFGLYLTVSTWGRGRSTHVPTRTCMGGMHSCSHVASSFIAKGATGTLTSLSRGELLRASVLLVQGQLFLTAGVAVTGHVFAQGVTSFLLCGEPAAASE